MIKVFSADSRFSGDLGWVRSHFSFSFGPYYDPENTGFGPMRVLNDDFIASEKGFGVHPHSDMEIVSLVLRGKLKHQDNLGNVGVTTWGQIQRMSAGTGIIHTESNASNDEELNLLQMWFMPSERGLTPSYEITEFDVDALTGQWLPIVSEKASKNVAKIHQDITIFLRRMDQAERTTYPTADQRRIFVFTIEGCVSINEANLLNKRDSARIEYEKLLTIKAAEQSVVMLIDMPL